MIITESPNTSKKSKAHKLSHQKQWQQKPSQHRNNESNNNNKDNNINNNRNKNYVGTYMYIIKFLSINNPTEEYTTPRNIIQHPNRHLENTQQQLQWTYNDAMLAQ